MCQVQSLGIRKCVAMTFVSRFGKIEAREKPETWLGPGIVQDL